MSGGSKFLLVSLPTYISLSNDHDEALTTLRSAVSTDFGTTSPFQIPTFKIGTLDALVQQADDLAKLATDCEAIVGRVSDSLANVLGGDEEKLAKQKNVNDKPVEQYLQSFSWNKMKYRSDKAIGDLMSAFKWELSALDNDVKAKFSQYNSTRNALAAAQKRQTGNLATKSLLSLVDPKLIVTDSEYLETHLIAVPRQLVKEYLRSYEHLCPMVVPRSSMEIASDEEFTLFAVTTFKKHSAEFVHKSREKRWTPRDFKYEEGDREKEQQEVKQLEKEESKILGEAVRLGWTGYSEAVMTLMHIYSLRVFVESVLRYGLPANYVCGVIKTTRKLAKKAKHSLDMEYSYLGGNAISRDRKGRPKGDDSQMQQEMQQAGHHDAEYTAFVYYEIDLDL